MNYNNGKRGFTLAEVLIVLLILTIIFAAFAPIITKRREAKSKYAVWNWANKTNDLSAYYDKGVKGHPGEAFLGITPSNKATNEFLPYSKLIIRSTPWEGSSKRIQKQIHFRYGYPADDIKYNADGSVNEAASTYMTLGYDVGSWLMDTKNILMGGSYKNLDSNYKDYKSEEDKYISDNLAFGYEALTNINNASGTNARAEGNLAIGYYAGFNDQANSKYNLYIGSFAGANTKKPNEEKTGNTFVGAYSGYINNGSYNTAIGYNAGKGPSSETYQTYSSSRNILVGAYAGYNIVGNNNIAIGYNALTKYGTELPEDITIEENSNNIAIGYNALGALKYGKNNIAIGYNACSQVEKASNKICIGANSGPKKKISDAYGSTNRKQRNDGKSYSEAYLNATQEDNEERIYIGGTPYNYGGDAVLEVHNVATQNKYLINSPFIESNVTTVINGNLIVNGRIYLTTGNTLRNFFKDSPHWSDGNIFGGTQKNVHCTNEDPITYDFKNGRNALCPNVIYSTAASTSNPPLGFSDRRLKRIGSRFNDGLSKVLQLEVKDYTFKKDANKVPQTGIIAQQLEKIFPRSVFEDKNGILSIKLDEMFYAAINALKELDKKIVTLVNKVTHVETKITKLEKENNILKKQVLDLELRVNNKIKAKRGL